MPLSKSLDAITEEDLLRLISDKEIENKTIEYKKCLPIDFKNPELKNEFLRDVSSFANASGGDLIYGIEEKGGLPINLSGMVIPDDEIDGKKRQLEEIIRSTSNIDPRIPSLSIRPIKLQNKNYVIIIRIPRSWASPHMVKLQFPARERFISRNSAGKYALDVSELRNAFLLTDSIEERIRNFRLDRVSKIIAEETPIPLAIEPKVVLHIIPIAAFGSSRILVDVSSLSRISSETGIQPICPGYSGQRYNLDGYLLHDRPTGESYSYLQIFRNGIIESVDTKLIGGDQTISGGSFDASVYRAIKNYLAFEKKAGIEAPYLIMLSLLKAQGCKLFLPFGRGATNKPIDRDILLVPEVMVDDSESSLDGIIRPILDSIWNATGYERSGSFDEEGKFKQIS